MFPSRAKKLYDLFVAHDSLEALPAAELARLEKRVFKKPVAAVWAETVRYYTDRLRDPGMVERAETKDPKLKMSMDFRVWCGPAIGAFNDFIAGTLLDPAIAKAYPC